MVTNIENITNAFKIYNDAYFGGFLPLPRFGVLHSYRICGCLEWSDITRNGDLVNPIIKVTDYYELDEETFRNILCHEMLHYYLMCLHFGEGGKHGKWFKKKAKQLNDKYGLNITIGTCVSNLKRRKAAPLLEYWLSHFFF